MSVVLTHRIDAWTFCFKSLSLSLSLCSSTLVHEQIPLDAEFVPL